MITISISAEAYQAIAGHFPEPSLRDDQGGYRFIVDHGTLDRLRAARRPTRNLQRRHPAAGEGRARPELISAEGRVRALLRLALKAPLVLRVTLLSLANDPGELVDRVDLPRRRRRPLEKM